MIEYLQMNIRKIIQSTLNFDFIYYYIYTRLRHNMLKIKKKILLLSLIYHQSCLFANSNTKPRATRAETCLRLTIKNYSPHKPK